MASPALKSRSTIPISMPAWRNGFGLTVVGSTRRAMTSDRLDDGAATAAVDSPLPVAWAPGWGGGAAHARSVQALSTTGRALLAQFTWFVLSRMGHRGGWDHVGLDPDGVIGILGQP